MKSVDTRDVDRDHGKGKRQREKVIETIQNENRSMENNSFHLQGLLKFGAPQGEVGPYKQCPNTWLNVDRPSIM